MTPTQPEYIITEDEWQLLYTVVPKKEERILHDIHSRPHAKSPDPISEMVSLLRKLCLKSECWGSESTDKCPFNTRGRIHCELTKIKNRLESDLDINNAAVVRATTLTERKKWIDATNNLLIWFGGDWHGAYIVNYGELITERVLDYDRAIEKIESLQQSMTGDD